MVSTDHVWHQPIEMTNPGLCWRIIEFMKMKTIGFLTSSTGRGERGDYIGSLEPGTTYLIKKMRLTHYRLEY